MTAAEPCPEIVIERTRGLRLFKGRELWAYRDLLWLLVWRDLAARYKQTVLGPLWYVIQPLLTTVVFTVVFGRFAHLPTAGTPAMLFYQSGLLIWSYFAATFNSTSSTLSMNAGLFGKVYFPRLIVPLSGVISNLAAFAMQGVVFIGLFVAYKQTSQAGTFGLNRSLWILPLVVVQVAALGLGTGLWLTALTARFRDFTVLSGFLIQLWMYGTPIILPLSQVPGAWRILFAANPMTAPVECFRRMLLGAGQPTLALCLSSLGVTAAILLSGLVLFNRAEKTFVDVA